MNFYSKNVKKYPFTHSNLPFTNYILTYVKKMSNFDVP